jgi:hypothetical protein
MPKYLTRLNYSDFFIYTIFENILKTYIIISFTFMTSKAHIATVNYEDFVSHNPDRKLNFIAHLGKSLAEIGFVLVRLYVMNFSVLLKNSSNSPTRSNLSMSFQSWRGKEVTSVNLKKQPKDLKPPI